jgi:cation diffusion facilitator family transporter
MRISLAVSLLMLAGKSLAFFMTHSTAILSDALESLVHGFATGFAAVSLWYASQPADVNHPYGHGRIAYFSAGFEGSLVLAASLSIIITGVLALIQGSQLTSLGTGLAITGGLAAINLVLGFGLIRVGKAHNEIIIIANGRHVLSDMWTSVAAIIGVGLVILTGWSWLDPVTAIIIGVFIMMTALRLLRESFAGLMDEVDPAISAKLTQVLRTAKDEERISGFHQLHCRRINKELWIDVHILVPGELRTDDAHTRVLIVEKRLVDAFPQDAVHVITHVEPDDHDLAHPEGHPSTGDPLTGP